MAAFGARVDRKSLRFTLIALGNARVSMGQATEAAVRAAGEVYMVAATLSVTEGDHTQAQLAALGHPYARRHGQLSLHAGDGRGWMLDGRHLVHFQTGRLARTLHATWRPAGASSTYDVGLDPNDAHVRKVLLGDRRMLPRDPLWSAAQGPKTVEGMQRAILRELGKVLRGQAHVRFG